jgi:DnaJ family protein B protein 12
MCRKFPIQRKTLNLKVPYFVKENFHTEYQGSLRRLEISVEEEYVTNLRHSCYREKNYSKYTWMYLLADGGGHCI